MSKILGIVGSARPWGNSELMLRQALMGARAVGAQVAMVRLTDLSLKSCTGCMRCVIGGEPCALDDDMAWLLEAIKATDGLVLAAPTYFLGPAAVVKLVLDRLLMATGRLSDPLPISRPAITLAAAGLEGWRGVSLPYLNALIAALGFRPIESLIAIAPGPGEVLLDEPLMERILAGGRQLVQGGWDATPPPKNACPICRCDAFVLDGGRAICPICGQEAELTWSDNQVQLRFDEHSGVESRWTPEGLRKHMIDWVQATGPRYRACRKEIKNRRAAYRSTDIPWLCPRPERDAAC